MGFYLRRENLRHQKLERAVGMDSEGWPTLPDAAFVLINVASQCMLPIPGDLQS